MHYRGSLPRRSSVESQDKQLSIDVGRRSFAKTRLQDDRPEMFNQFQHLEILLNSNLDKPAVIDFSVLTNLFMGVADLAEGDVMRPMNRVSTGTFRIAGLSK